MPAGFFTKLIFDSFILGSDVFTFLAFAAVLMKMSKAHSSAGLSLQSLVAILTLRIMHAMSHFYSMHYVPRALWMLPFQCLDVSVVMAGTACVVAVLSRYYSTYEVEKDNFGIQLFDKFDLLPKDGTGRIRPLAAQAFLYMLAGVVSIVWAMVKSSNSHMAWYTCFMEGLSAVALLPQLWMFQHDKRVDSQLASFVVCVAANRLCTLMFWTFITFMIPTAPLNRPAQMFLEVMNLLILADFLYYWVRAKIRGDKEIILGSDCGV